VLMSDRGAKHPTASSSTSKENFTLGTATTSAVTFGQTGLHQMASKGITTMDKLQYKRFATDWVRVTGNVTRFPRQSANVIERPPIKFRSLPLTEGTVMWPWIGPA